MVHVVQDTWVYWNWYNDELRAVPTSSTSSQQHVIRPWKQPYSTDWLIIDYFSLIQWCSDASSETKCFGRCKKHPNHFTARQRQSVLYPVALLELTIVIDNATRIGCWQAKRTIPIKWSNEQQPPIVTQTYYRLLLHALFHSATTNGFLFNEVLDVILSGSVSPGTVIAFSHTLYQHGCITLHQHAYSRLINADPGSTPQVRFLLDPLTHPKLYETDWNEFAQHIALCVHAGFLTLPLTLPPPPAPDCRQMVPYMATFDLYHRSHVLTSIRCVLYAVLVRMTGFISYFSQSTQLLANAVHMVASQTRTWRGMSWISSVHNYQLPFLPPHCTIPDPRVTFPCLKAALVDDEGKLYAVTYASGGGKEEEVSLLEGEEEDQEAPKHKHPPEFRPLFPSQGAPRHKHILQRTAIDDVRVCINWNQGDIAECPELAAGQDCDPYFRPRLSEADMAWIESESNQKNMNLPETRELQAQLTAYYRQVHEVEAAMVTAQMHKVLTKAYETGLCDGSNAGQKRKQPPPPSHPAPTHAESVALNAASAWPFRDQQRAYPLPNPPQIPNIVQATVVSHRPTFTEQRGLVYQHHAHSFFYDHNYCTTLIKGDYVSYQPADPPTQHPPLVVKLGGTVSVFDYFRQRSEWALELLVMGCFGLDAASTQKQCLPRVINSQQPSLHFRSQTEASLQTPPHIQQCQDHILQHLPILLNTLQPTPAVSQASRLGYFHDTLTHLNLLTALPLYDTLVSLTSPSP